MHRFASRRGRRHGLSVAIEGCEPRRLFSNVAWVDMGSSNGKQLSQSVSTASGVTSTTLVRGGSLYTPDSTENDQVGAMYGHPRQSNGQYATSESGAVSKEHYYTFSVTPSSGKSITLDTLDFAPFVENGTVGTSIAVEYKVGSGSYTTAWTGTANATGSQVPFKTATFSGLTNLVDTVEFRIVFWNAANYSSTSIGWRTGNDIVLAGSVNTLPLAPSSVVAKPNIHTLENDVTWTDNATDETSYTVVRTTLPSYDDPQVTFLAANSTSFEDDSIEPGVRYEYTISAVKSTAGSSGGVAAQTTAIHIYESWNQQLWRSEFSDPDHIRPTSYDFDKSVIVMGDNAYSDVYGAWAPTNNDQGVPDFNTLNEANIRQAVDDLPPDGILIDDIEHYTSYVADLGLNYTAINARVDTAIAWHQAWAAIARDENPDVRLALYDSTSALFPWYSTDQITTYEYATNRLIDALFTPDYFNIAAPAIYANGDDFSAWQSIREDQVDILMSNGVQVMPMYDEVTLSGTPRELTTGELDQVAALIKTAGDQAIRWDGPDIIWSDDRADAQDEIVNWLASH
jgi:hypothetical protein